MDFATSCEDWGVLLSHRKAICSEHWLSLGRESSFSLSGSRCRRYASRIWRFARLRSAAWCNLFFATDTNTFIGSTGIVVEL